MKNLLALLFILIPVSASAESMIGTVQNISEEYGNLESSITSAAMESLGITVNNHFVMDYLGTKITVYFGKSCCD